MMVLVIGSRYRCSPFVDRAQGAGTRPGPEPLPELAHHQPNGEYRSLLLGAPPSWRRPARWMSEPWASTTVRSRSPRCSRRSTLVCCMPERLCWNARAGSLWRRHDRRGQAGPGPVGYEELPWKYGVGTPNVLGSTRTRGVFLVPRPCCGLELGIQSVLDACELGIAQAHGVCFPHCVGEDHVARHPGLVL